MVTVALLGPYIDYLENSPMKENKEQTFNLKPYEKWALAKLQKRTDIRFSFSYCL